MDNQVVEVGSGILVAEGTQAEEDTGFFVGWEVVNKLVAGEDTPVAGDMVGSAEVDTRKVVVTEGSTAADCSWTAVDRLAAAD